MSQEVSWEELLGEIDEKGKQVAEILRLKFRDTPVVEQDEQWKQEIQVLADSIPPQHLTHHLLRRLERHKIRVRGGASFHRYMVEDSEIRKLKLNSLSWRLNRKTTAYRFVDSLGVRRPRTDLEPSSFDDVQWQYPGVLKAVSGTGGRGAYLLLAEDEIVHVHDEKRLASHAELRQHVRRLMGPRTKRRLPDQWIMEELILEDRIHRTPARDIKFFSFYGEVLFVLEVRRRGRDSLYSFTEPDGSPIKPKVNNYTYFEGAGASADDLKLASRISESIPHPFMRIDMLKGAEGLVFGEFTPRPGAFHQYTAEWDRRMGEAWLRAEDRLQFDLLSGKRFESFLSTTGAYRERGISVA